LPPQAQGAGGPLGGVAGLPMGDLSLTGGVGGVGQLLEPETVYLYIPNVAVEHKQNQVKSEKTG
jgi:hypothetical protein